MPSRSSRPGLADLVMVRAVADLERDGASWIETQEGAAGTSGLDPVIERAWRIGSSRELERPVERAVGALGLLWPAAGAAGAVAGVGAAWAGLAGGGDPTRPETGQLNPLWFLQITLGVHSLLLVLSVVVLIWALAGRQHPWTGIARTLGRLLGRASAGRGAASRATANVALGGRRGVWLASGLGHAAGIGFIIGALVAVFVAAGFREDYRFFWKSTLLSDAQGAALINGVAAGPRALGMPTPTREEISAARVGADPTRDSGSPSDWAWMLAGSLVIWGAAPRLAALGAAVVAVRVSTRRAGLPVSESYRLRVLERMRGAEERETGVGAPGATPEPEIGSGEAREDDRPLGPPVVMGYEADLDGGWPPRGLDSCVDLGLIDGEPDRRRVLELLDGGSTRPSAVVCVFSRGETPAAAERRFLSSLASRGGARAAVVLGLGRSLGTDRTSRDAERIEHRTGLWREAAERAGVDPDRIAAVDLAHLTPETVGRLRSLAGNHDNAASGAAGSGALDGSLDDVDAWALGADHSRESLARLLRSIEGRFGGEPGWRRAVRGFGEARDFGAVRDSAMESARSVMRVLPGWMPRHPGWMTATATLVTTGTLGTVLLAGGPIGIAAGAWPLYAAVGAAIGEMAGRGAGAVTPREPRDEEAVVAGARAAVLHALVLSLQGRDDAEIARLIDRTLRDAPAVDSGAGVPALTAHIRDAAREAGEGGL